MINAWCIKENLWDFNKRKYSPISGEYLLETFVSRQRISTKYSSSGKSNMFVADTPEKITGLKSAMTPGG